MKDLVKVGLAFTLILLAWTSSFSQTAWFARDTTSVLMRSGSPMGFPWAGGLNAAQYHQMDLDGDGQQDLVLFDRTNSKFSTFLAVRDSAGNAWHWSYKPVYESRFPVVHNWVFLADYNGDGHKDLFASTALGVQLYQFDAGPADWKWTLMRDALYTKGFSGFLNLLISGSDIPAIVDVDDDGDLDILGFDYSGTFIELHQNMSVERYGVPDSLGSRTNPIFIRNGDCWGDFSKNSAQEYVLGEDCGVVANPDNGRVMHSGNSILVTDLNGDGMKDLIVGHISSPNLSVFYNGRRGVNAGFTSYEKTYPKIDPVAMHIFPAAFRADMDLDGVEDLVVTPNVPSGDPGLSDFSQSNWLYRNTGGDENVDFRFLTTNVLQDQMLDVGENAAPSFYDVDGDGDLDMVVGTGPLPGRAGLQSSLWLLENIGTATSPVYEIRSQDFASVESRIKGYNFRPQWSDFDGNGTTDLGLAYYTARGMSFAYIPNRSQPGRSVDLSGSAVDIPLPSGAYTNDIPYFVDSDHDGDLDLLLGKALGNLFYYVNDGTPARPVFRLVTENFANTSISFERRSVQAISEDFDLDGNPDLITVDYSGKIRIHHQGEWGKWQKTEEILIKSSGIPQAPTLGQALYASVADYNGDGKPDVAVGSNAGGIQLFQNILPVEVPQGDNEVFNVSPNPASSYIRMRPLVGGMLSVYNIKGQLVMPQIAVRQGQFRQIPTENWAAGLYVFRLETQQGSFTKKLVITP